MRWTSARGATAAGVLPAAFLVALLVGAPFAGTTTAPLIADRAATAPATTAEQAPATSYDAPAAVTAEDGTATETTARGDGSASTARPTLTVPRASMTTLVVAWVTLAFVGLAVLLAAAQGAGRRAAQASGSVSGASARS